MKDEKLYVIHIWESIERVQEYVKDGEKSFRDSTLTQDAVLQNLHTIADSTQRLSDALKNRRPEVDWRGIAGFRNVLVHDYLGIDLDRVWRVVEKDIPVLKEKIQRILEDMGGLSGCE